ncbi:MAG: class I SAM-dependent methyltransferase [Candidatus Sulfotelmatobacter sp.]
MNANTQPREPRYSKTESVRGMDIVNPSLTDFSYLDCRRRTQLIRDTAARLQAGGKVLLDIGGRGKPYAEYFSGRVLWHFVVDIEPGASVDIVGDARSLPVADGSVDVVLCTQVIEHIPEPVPVLQEIFRVLRPGGTLILSAPAIFPQHGSPGDYWRYMPQGLAWLLQDFRTLEIQGETGTVGSLFLVLNMYLYMFTGPWPWMRRLVSLCVCPITNLLGRAAAAIYRGDQFASNYFVVATR